MEEQDILKLAREAGFEAALLPASQVPTDAKFRPFCEENRCGQYNANYSCPPTCGTPEQMGARIYAGKTALVLKTDWPIESYADTAAIKDAKLSHNRAMLRLNETLRRGQLLLPVFSLPHEDGGGVPVPRAAVQLHVRLLRGCGRAGQALRHGFPVGYEAFVGV